MNVRPIALPSLLMIVACAPTVESDASCPDDLSEACTTVVSIILRDGKLAGIAAPMTCVSVVNPLVDVTTVIDVSCTPLAPVFEAAGERCYEAGVRLDAFTGYFAGTASCGVIKAGCDTRADGNPCEASESGNPQSVQPRCRVVAGPYTSGKITCSFNGRPIA